MATMKMPAVGVEGGGTINSIPDYCEAKSVATQGTATFTFQQKPKLILILHSYYTGSFVARNYCVKDNGTWKRWTISGNVSQTYTESDLNALAGSVTETDTSLSVSGAWAGSTSEFVVMAWY